MRLIIIGRCWNEDISNDSIYDSYKKLDIQPIKINPEINMEAPATSMGEYKETSFVENRTPIANPNAERIASISPKVIMIDGFVIIVCMLVTVKNIRIARYSHKESYQCQNNTNNLDLI